MLLYRSIMTIPTLLNICLEFVSDNLYSLLSVIYVTDSDMFDTSGNDIYLDNSFLPHKFTFRSDIFFPENIAEKLITLLSRKGKLNDETMKLFERETTRLRYLCRIFK